MNIEVRQIHVICFKIKPLFWPYFIFHFIDLAENTNRARYYYLRGRTLNVVPLYNKEAEDILSKAIKLDPKFVDAWNELGECYWKNDNFTEAVNCFEKALLYVRNST